MAASHRTVFMAQTLTMECQLLVTSIKAGSECHGTVRQAPASRLFSKALFQGWTCTNYCIHENLKRTRLQHISVQWCALPAQLPVPLEIWTLPSLFLVHTHTQEELEGPKSATAMPSIGNCPGKAGSSVHQGDVTIQHTGSSHLSTAGTETIFFPVEKLITFRRCWYAWKLFLPTSNRWTNCAVSVCSW